MKTYSLYVSFYLFFKNVISFCVVLILHELLAFLYPKPPKHHYREHNYKSWHWLSVAFNPAAGRDSSWQISSYSSADLLIQVLLASAAASAWHYIDVTVCSNHSKTNPCIPWDVEWSQSRPIVFSYTFFGHNFTPIGTLNLF